MKKILYLSHHNYDLSKRWYIRYLGVGANGMSATIKTYGFINNKKTVQGRIEVANALMEKMDKELNHNPLKIEKKFNEIKSTLIDSLEEIKPTLRKKTYWTYYSKINIFCQWCDKNALTTMQDLSKSIITRFLNELLENRSNVTYNAYKNILYRLTKNEIFVKKNLAKMSVPAKFFSQKQKEQIRDLLKDDYPQIWLFCQAIYFTLIRPGELRQLRLSNIDMENQSITVPAHISKNKKTQTISMPDGFYTELLAIGVDSLPESYYLFGTAGVPSQKPRKIDFFAKKHQAVLKSIGYDTTLYKLYSWKHTGVVGMIKVGAGEKEIQVQGRWHSLDMLDKYLRQLGYSDFSIVKSKHKM